MRIAILAILATLITGCAMPKQGVEPGREEFFERDAKICINKRCAVGYMVAPLAPRYEIEIWNPVGDHDYLVAETCHNFIRFEDEGGHHKFTYVPDDHFEKKGKCVMIFSSYDKKNKDAFAFVAFDDPYYGLKGRTRCSGAGLKQHNGVSVCMAKAEKDQAVVFLEPVVMDPDPKCDTGKLIRGGKMWVYDMPAGLCQVRFMSERTGKIHLHYMIGFIDARIEK